jgi:hypothetical protein
MTNCPTFSATVSIDTRWYQLDLNSKSPVIQYFDNRITWTGVGVRLAADSQSTSKSGYRASLWTIDQILSCSSFFVWQLRFSSFKAPSLTRKRVCSLQCNHSLVRLLTPNSHTLPSHLRLCSHEREWVSELIYDRQSVGQSVLVSGAHLGPVTNFSFSLKFILDIYGFVSL